MYFHGFLRAISCLIRQPLADNTLERDFRALGVIDAKLGAGVLAEIELGQIAVKMPLIDMLIDANKSAFNYAEKALKGIGMNIAARSFKLGMVNAVVFGNGRQRIVTGFVSHKAAIGVNHAPQVFCNATMIEANRANVAATFGKAKD